MSPTFTNHHSTAASVTMYVPFIEFSYQPRLVEALIQKIPEQSSDEFCWQQPKWRIKDWENTSRIKAFHRKSKVKEYYRCFTALVSRCVGKHPKEPERTMVCWMPRGCRADLPHTLWIRTQPSHMGGICRMTLLVACSSMFGACMQ